jgi:hypothetical protein
MRGQPAKVLAASPASNDRGSKPLRAGILGLELFERFAVTLNRHAKTVTLTPLENFEAKPRGVAVPIRFTEDAPITDGTFADVAGEFELDSGDSGPAIIEGYWAGQQRLADRLGRGVIWSGGGVGGDFQETLSRGDITLGPLKLPGEVVSYVGVPERGSEATRMQAGVVGESSLYRFDMTYDYGRGRVWIDPQTDIAPRPFNRTGLRLKKDGDKNFVVTLVVPNSPAADAGVTPGDRVLDIAGQPATGLAPSEATVLMSGPAASDLAITVASKTDGSKRALDLRLRDILP